MSTQNTSEEIDLGFFIKKSNDVFKSMARGFFLVLDFIKRFFIWIIVLILIGFAIGYYKDIRTQKVYDNQIILIPNFESVDYLYDKVEAINLKIRAQDSTYLKSIFGEKYGLLGNIEIEPIVDIYNFVSKSRTNIDILRILSQNQNFSDYINDISTSKYYKYHRMKLSIIGKDHSKAVIDQLFKYLNSNEHFKTYQDIYVETKMYDIEEHFDMVAQIDSLVKASSRMYESGSNVSVNNNSDLHFLIERKRLVIEDLYQLRMEYADYTEPIKIVSTDYNLTPKKVLNLPNKIKYPIIFVLLFGLVFFVLYLFRRLRNYAEIDS